MVHITTSTSAGLICSNWVVIFCLSAFTAARSVSFLSLRTASLNVSIMLSRLLVYSSADTRFLGPGQGVPLSSSMGMLTISGDSAIALLCKELMYWIPCLMEWQQLLTPQKLSSE